MSSKQTYSIFFFLRKIMTLDQKKKTSTHTLNACDEASFDTNCLDLLLEINFLKYVLFK